MCSPTRFGLYTGRYPARLAGGVKEPIGGPNELDGIPLDHPTLATLLKDQGYDTAMFGKWHCGYLPWYSPTRVGWDEFFGNFSGGIDYFSKINHNGDHDLFEDEVEVEDLRYYTEIVTEKAVGFIERDHDIPWLLNLNFTTPHWPWEGPGDRAVSDELTARIEAGENRRCSSTTTAARGRSTTDGRGPGPVDRQGPQGTRAHGPARDTVVFFASDNGGERSRTCGRSPAGRATRSRAASGCRPS